jgi:hypothetical protein
MTPVTFQLVAQCLNQLRHRMPPERVRGYMFIFYIPKFNSCNSNAVQTDVHTVNCPYMTHRTRDASNALAHTRAYKTQV